MSHYRHIHLGELETLSHGNSGFVVRMLQSCLKSIPEQVELLHQGLRDNDRETVQMAAHRLRPAFHYLCRADISTQLEALEKAALNGERDVLFETISALSAQAGHVITDARQALDGYAG
jgi:HPt (histidine-containing phosphotransfer) domain-containing protein